MDWFDLHSALKMYRVIISSLLASQLSAARTPEQQRSIDACKAGNHIVVVGPKIYVAEAHSRVDNPDGRIFCYVKESNRDDPLYFGETIPLFDGADGYPNILHPITGQSMSASVGHRH